MENYVKIMKINLACLSETFSTNFTIENYSIADFPQECNDGEPYSVVYLSFSLKLSTEYVKS